MNLDKKILGEKAKELNFVRDSEKEFLEKFEKKEYRPELLFDDEKILERIEKHPMVLWKTTQ